MKLIHGFRPALAVLVLTLVGGEVVSAQEAKKINEVEGIAEYRLANGVQALLFPDQSKPSGAC